MKYSIFLLIVTLYSCSDTLDGAIEERGNKKLYLVNKSKEKIMAFTVKATIIKNDSISDYKTEVITLQPGDEQFLTEKEIVVEGEEIINLVPIDSPYVPNKKLSDTTYRFKFEITGQREIKLKQ